MAMRNTKEKVSEKGTSIDDGDGEEEGRFKVASNGSFVLLADKKSVEMAKVGNAVGN